MQARVFSVRLRLVLWVDQRLRAILSTMVPSCMEVVMGRSFRLWQEVYAFRGHGCDGTGSDGDAILVFRPVK